MATPPPLPIEPPEPGAKPRGSVTFPVLYRGEPTEVLLDWDSDRKLYRMVVICKGAKLFQGEGKPGAVMDLLGVYQVKASSQFWVCFLEGTGINDKHWAWNPEKKSFEEWKPGYQPIYPKS
jgi:hypothetical protein